MLNASMLSLSLRLVSVLVLRERTGDAGV